jgi:predicted metal-binding protein
MSVNQRFYASVDVKDFLAGYVDVERFIECCKACPHYGKRRTCPPYDFDVPALWRQYAVLDVVAIRIPSSQSYEQTEEALLDELFILEKSNPGSMCLSAGNCGVSEGDRLRYSIESLGGNVDKLCRELLGVPLEWEKEGVAPGHIMLVAGLLKK